MTDESRYATVIFLNAVLPVLKPIIAARPGLAKGFAGRNGVIQISALSPDGVSVDGRAPRLATQLVVDDGTVSVALGPHRAPSVELQFGSTAKLNAFFTGKPALPRISGGLANPRLLIATVRALLAMSALLGAKRPPAAIADQELLTKAMFYLLTSGISQLNKAGHPQARRWSAGQPDRVYQLAVDDAPDLAAYVRVKGGRTKAARGRYTRSQPFFAMNFDSAASALGTLLETDDMITATTAGRIRLQGAPEYGAELGELLKLVGSYAK